MKTTDRDLEEFLRDYIEPLPLPPVETLARDRIRELCQMKRRQRRDVRVIHLKRRGK